jgi:hypothetical protein
MYEVSRDRDILRPVKRCFDFPLPIKRQTSEERIAAAQLAHELSEKGGAA